MATNKVKQHVLNNAGARVDGQLDIVDKLITTQINLGTLRIIDKVPKVGAYDAYNFSGRRVVDTDRDGMPDAWEKLHANEGYDYRKADGDKDYDNDGLTNVEEYLSDRIL